MPAIKTLRCSAALSSSVIVDWVDNGFDFSSEAEQVGESVANKIQIAEKNCFKQPFTPND